MHIPSTFKTKLARGAILLLSYVGAIGVNLVTSTHPVAAFCIAVLAVLWSAYTFWPEIKALRIIYPRGAPLESPAWLYLFSIASLGVVFIGFYSLYIASTRRPSILTDAEMSRPYIQGKYFKIADLADGENVIVGRTFEDCHIYGPAVLFLLDRNTLIEPHVMGSLDEAFLAAPATNRAGPHTGIIVLRECTFKRCTLFNITFVGASEDIERYKKSAVTKP